MSSGGAQSLCILSTYPYHGYGVAGPVTGASPGLWGDLEDPLRVENEEGGKSVKAYHLVKKAVAWPGQGRNGL